MQLNPVTAFRAYTTDYVTDPAFGRVWKILGHGIHQRWIEFNDDVDDTEWQVLKAIARK